MARCGRGQRHGEDCTRMTHADSLTVVVDIGKSGVRLRTQPSTVTQHGPGAAPERASSLGAGAHLAELVRAAWRNGTPPRGRVTRAVVGTTMLPTPDDLAHSRALLLELWPEAELTIVSDGVLAHAAALGEVGTVASIGTGASILGLDRSGLLRQLDGWGPDLGDRGSAAELGRVGLRIARATADGVADGTALFEAALAWNGEPWGLRAATSLLAAPDRIERIASFAIHVCAVAASGDETALRIVRAAAEQAVESCAAMARAIGESTVVCVGGLAQAEPYRAALAAALHAHGLHQQEPRTNVLDVPREILDRPHYRREPKRPEPGGIRRADTEKE